MQSNTLAVLNLSIACNLPVASIDGPTLDESKQPATDALTSMSSSHVPTLQIWNRCRARPFDVIVAHRNFRKSYQLPIGLGHDNDSLAREKLLHLKLMAIDGAFGPKLKPKSHPSGTIFGLRGAKSGLHVER
jgi:hypothetical protein